MDKKVARKRRGLKARAKIRTLNIVRLCVHRTPRHIYAQVISADGQQVLASASSVEKSFKQKQPIGGNVNAAQLVGKLIGERAVKAGIKNVAFDRSGFKYHGRIKALAENARESGLEF